MQPPKTNVPLTPQGPPSPGPCPLQPRTDAPEAAKATGQGDGTEDGGRRLAWRPGPAHLPSHSTGLALRMCPADPHGTSPGASVWVMPGCSLRSQTNHPKRPHGCVHSGPPLHHPPGLAWGLRLAWGLCTLTEGAGLLWGLVPSSLSSLRDDSRGQVSLSHLAQSATEATLGPGHVQVQDQPAPGTHIAGDSQFRHSFQRQ